MSVVVYLGATECGKSFRANIVSKNYKKVIIYDNARCFNDGTIIEDFSPAGFASVFKKFVLQDSFRLIFRAPYSMKEQEGAERVARLIYSGFGRYWKEQNTNQSRICFLVDEADKVSSTSRDGLFYLTVTKGRHFFIDTHAISQGPGRLPLYYRENASEVYCFRMRAHEYLRELFGSEHLRRISTLGNFSYMHWRDNGEITLFDKFAKAVKKWKC